jgi:hypothetical protein
VEIVYAENARKILKKIHENMLEGGGTGKCGRVCN